MRAQKVTLLSDIIVITLDSSFPVKYPKITNSTCFILLFYLFVITHQFG